MVAFFRSPCTICIWDSHTRVKSSYAYGISHTHTGHPVRIWGKMYIWGVTVWISISNARIPGYRKLIPCIFNGNLLGKPPEYHGKHLQIRTNENLLMTLFGDQIGLESLERITAKLRKEFLFEIFLGIDFLFSQPQGWELPNRGTQRRLVPY